MTNNTQQLPAEVVEELEAAAQDKYSKMAENAEDVKDDAYAQGYAEGWHTGATEYATKLHSASVEKLNLKMTIKGIEDQLTVERVKHNTARSLLSKFISRHEAGLLPDRFIYNEIKSFLDGQK